MDVLQLPARKRKILSIKIPRDEPQRATPRAEARYFVWREGGGMPTRTYDEPATPCGHASELAKKNPGERFHVMRSWRVIGTCEGAEND